MQHLDWVKEAVTKIEADFNRSSDTHLIKLNLPFTADIHLYLRHVSIELYSLTVMLRVSQAA